MIDRELARVNGQIFGGGVGASCSAVDQDMVPALIPIWLRLVLVIPSLVGLARFVEIDDDASVSVSAMADKLPWFEARSILIAVGVGAIDCDHDCFPPAGVADWEKVRMLI